jgi:glycosyltransferase involved in cell wall biosynthesis
MSEKITVITSSARGSDVYYRAFIFAKSLIKNGRKVSFIATPFSGVLVFLYSVVKFIRIIFSSKTVVLFNPSIFDIVPFYIKKLTGARVICDVWFPSSCFERKTFTGNFFIKLSERITYSNKNIPILLKKNYGIKDNKLYNLKTGGNGFDIACESNQTSKAPDVSLKTKKILYAGCLDNIKVVDEVLEAFSIIGDYADDVVFVFAGSISFKNFLYVKQGMKNLGLSEKTVFKKNIDPCGFKKLVLESDIIIDFLRNEKEDYFLERVFLREAINSGKSVVCTDAGELVLFKDYTYQTKPDQVLLVEALSGIFANGPDGREKEGPFYIKENLDWIKIAASFLKETGL